MLEAYYIQMVQSADHWIESTKGEESSNSLSQVVSLEARVDQSRIALSDAVHLVLKDTSALRSIARNATCVRRGLAFAHT